MLAIPGKQLLRSDGVAIALRHFPAIHEKHISMQPILCRGATAGAVVLSDFIFVMRKFQVISTTMYVEGFAKIFGTHGGAFQMPARETNGPWGFPPHDVFGACFDPNCKIGR